MSRNPLQSKLIQIVEPVVQAAGLELVDLRFLLEQGGWVLRVQIDIPVAGVTDLNQVPSERVSLSECEDMSRELSAVLDVDDPIKQAYHLEISSPGIDRPLRTPDHYRHFVDSEAKIQLGVPLIIPASPASPAGGERRNFKGVLKGMSPDSQKVLIECDGTLFELPLDDIDSAKLVPDWDAVMRGQSGIGKAPLNKPIKPGHRPSAKPKNPKPQRHD